MDITEYSVSPLEVIQRRMKVSSSVVLDPIYFHNMDKNNLSIFENIIFCVLHRIESHKCCKGQIVQVKNRIHTE